MLPLGIQKLNLNSNVLNQFPDTRGLPNLQYIDLSYNRIVGAPTENKVDAENQIAELLMDENSLTALPDLCIFPKLKKLSLYANKIRIIGRYCYDLAANEWCFDVLTLRSLKGCNGFQYPKRDAIKS